MEYPQYAVYRPAVCDRRDNGVHTVCSVQTSSVSVASDGACHPLNMCFLASLGGK